MSGRTRRNPRDVTGTIADQLAEAHQAELKARTGQISTVTGSVPTEPDGPQEVDYSNVAQPPGDGEKSGKVELKQKTRKIQVNTDLEDVTIGYGNEFDFKRGTTYTVPEWIADYLEERGLVWH